jgi:predicted RNA-binding Zn ribbon-like protein
MLAPLAVAQRPPATISTFMSINMTDSRGPAMFLADSLGLDFLNSVAVPVDTQVEWIESGEDLLAWLEQAGMVSSEVLAEIRRTAGPGQLDAAATQAKALREWFRTFVRRHKGRRLTRKAISELEPLNRLLARDEEFGQVLPRGKGHGAEHATDLEWVPQRRWRSADSLLLPIAKGMAELLVSADFTHVKACEGPVCTLLFLDKTRGHKRRWCSMALCGNRAKQASHRSRVNAALGK